MLRIVMKNIPFPVPGMGWERRFFVLNICVNEMGEDACISTKVEVIKISLCMERLSFPEEET
jgi:hypothetical protein